MPIACIESLQIESVMEKGIDGPVTVRKIKLTMPKRKELLELIGKHKAVNAFKETESDHGSIEEDWTVTVVHTTKEEYQRAVNERHGEQEHHH